MALKPLQTTIKPPLPYTNHQHHKAGHGKTIRVIGEGNAAHVDAQQTGNKGDGQEDAGQHAEAIHDAAHANVQTSVFSLKHKPHALAGQFELLEVARQTIVQFVPVICIIGRKPWQLGACQLTENIALRGKKTTQCGSPSADLQNSAMLGCIRSSASILSSSSSTISDSSPIRSCTFNVRC